MRLQNRVQAIDAIAVKGDVEDRTHVFKRAILSLPRTYIVEEAAWSADIALGELQWWNILSAYARPPSVVNAKYILGSDVQITEANLQNVEQHLRKGARAKVLSLKGATPGSSLGATDVVTESSEPTDVNDRGALWFTCACSGPPDFVNTFASIS